MTAAIHTTAGNHCGPRSQRGLEIYSTPACAVEALLRVEPLPAVCWEACGTEESAIATVLRAHGRRVVCTDLATDGVDFLTRRTAPLGQPIAIVCNPPFSKAAAFVRHGLGLVSKVVVLERLQFLESESRAALFDSGTLARVWIFRNRVPRMHKDGWTGRRAAPAMALAWFIFDGHHNGSAPALGWIRA
jgi:hypothetical protein